jgi:uncharacterized protein YyaL (SSP411 family)
MTLPNLTQNFPQQATLASAATLLLLTLNACRPETEATSSDAPETIHVSQVHENALPIEKSSFLTSHATSTIHWQDWDDQLFKHATSERKTIFAFIGSGTDANSMEALEQLNQSPASCAILNEHHVNVLIDSNIHPDIEFQAALLCLQSKMPPATPLLVWLTHDGHPISWTPVGTNSTRNIHTTISKSSKTIYQVWQNDPSYVLQTSRDKFNRRLTSSLPKPPEKIDPLLPIRSVRQAASLFDPTSGTIDGMGKMSPARYITLLLAASHHPDTSDDQRARYAKVANLTANKILLHGLIDPLDGGVYSGIQQVTSDLPVFSKTLKSQALTMQALYLLYQVSGDQKHLQAADAILNYTEKKLSLPDQGYSLGVVHATNSAKDNPCIWTLEEIEAALTKEESRICTLAFGLRGLGNIPPMDDRDRSYFRKNTLTWKISLQELATQTSLDAATLKQRLESSTKKLAKLRQEKPLKATKEDLSTVGSTALFASSCISAYRATGDPAHLNRATKLLTFIRQNFLDESGNLRRARYHGKLQPYPATGADHALVCQAALDLQQVTLDPTWLDFASDIHQRMHTLLGDPLTHHIKESADTHYPQAYPTYQFANFRALDNNCTWALAYSNAKRLALQHPGNQLKAQYEALAGILQTTASVDPIPSIDFLTADAKLHQKSVYIKTPTTATTQELLQVAVKTPCQIIPVTDKGNYPELGEQAAKLPAGTAAVVSQGKIIGTAANADELHALLK